MKKTKKLIVLLMALLMLLVGCSTTTSKTADASEKTKIRLAAQATSGQVFQFLAEDKGYLEEEGVDVELVYINNGSDAFSALSSGQVDVISTYGTGGPLIQIANGQEFTIFGGYMIIGATPVFAMPDTVYNSVEDFRGKKIAIMRGGTPDIVLKGILHDAGFDLEKDVTFVEMKRNPDVMEAVRNGEVDFGAVSTGFELQIAEAGMKIVLWPDELWPNHSCCRMIAKTSWLEENPEAAQKLLRAYLRAEEAMQEDMGRVVELTVENLDMSVETAESFLLSPHMIYETDPYKNSVITMWKKMQSFGYIIDPTIDIEDHINTSNYKAALDSLMRDYPNSSFLKEKLMMFENNNL
ncbi:ABC-type nitrate/sulfonate/bicarbonate transport system, periplasmic component [Clostridium aceticum]|uniref:ABC-type nitrate/sulfonate/bicarbonate transport system, periplasmic component n=1 Tax=Clostridium aceticum TaxID=84022 RepID=A0A0D8I8Z0_9CLOT|nr:ABC transporter substrate-binding protein [Clostridium aceticum]AKL95690.1 ABC-type nitrate/sulfonate/bicarbonate transport system, periplasmic component [Clostridium aceticum]KJF26755.1 nitrate ABC transporter substrate-binding protein [Clostridium aceticum]